MKPVSKRGPRGLLTSFFFEPRSLRRWTLLLQVLRRLVRRRAARRPAAPLLARLYLRWAPNTLKSVAWPPGC